MSHALRRVLWPTVAMLGALSILITLGTWQLARKDEKEALIRAVNARAFGEAMLLPPRAEWPRLDLDRFDFQKVVVNGTFRPGREYHVYTILPEARGRPAQPGWWVYAPFDVAGGGTVIVNRGFVPVAHKDFAARPLSAPAEAQVMVEGLLRRPEARGTFTNPDDPARNTFYTRDAAAFARAGGLGEVAPFTIEQTSPNPTPLPLAGQTRVTFPNRHLEYAMTWYLLGATLVGVWGVFIWRRTRPSPPTRIAGTTSP